MCCAEYLELLKKCVLGELYWENEQRIIYLRDCLEGRDSYSPDALLRIADARPAMAEKYRDACVDGRFLDDRIDNLGFRHTMIGRLRLDNIAACLDAIRASNVPGDLIECGVCRGGATIFMRGYLKAHGITDRTVWVADSFAGLPPPSMEQDAGYDMSAAAYPMLVIPLEAVRELFARYGLLDDQVRFLPGWFKDTLPAAPIEKLALLRIDGDLYESTMNALESLYPKLSPGGFTIVDDYDCLEPCRRAVDDYRTRTGISTPLQRIDWTGVFWQKDHICAESRMTITIDTGVNTLTVREHESSRQMSLFSPEAFHILSRQWLALGWNLGHWKTFSWMGRQFQQLPDDVLRLAELMWRVRPDVIVETGVWDGGSTLFFSSLCRLQQRGRVVSVERHWRPGVREAIASAAGDLATVIEGDSATAETAARVRSLLRDGERVCVFLDSDHSAEHVRKELEHLADLVTPGCYLIVADSNLPELAHTPNGAKEWVRDHPGEAVNQFLAAHSEFRPERPAPLVPAECDFSGLSYFPRTWLKRLY